MDEKTFQRIQKSQHTLQTPDNIDTTGLGLTIARKLIESQTGILWARSNPDDGNTFYFTLPKVMEHDSFGAMKAVLSAGLNS
jgi:light-regulated signal transduction histidine kinase (bacteriophytochrome)